MSSLISAENTWALWAILAFCAAAAIYLEQKYSWANKVTGCILALLFTLILSNVGIIPTESPVYDSVWSYVVPLAVPMLLFNANIKKIGKESGKLLIIYLIGSLGTVLGGFVAFFALRNLIPNLNDILPMFVGTYIGGSVNFVAMSTAYKVPSATVSAALVADNLLMALYFFTLIALPSLGFIKKNYSHPYIDKLESEADKETDKTMAAQYWGSKEISLKDIAFTVATAFVIVAISVKLSDVINASFTGGGKVTEILVKFFGNQYLLITTFTMILASVFPKFFNNIRGSQEIGTFLIYLFFAVIGAPASIKLIIMESPLLLVLALIIVLVNMIVTLIFAKLLHFSIEEAIIASNANVGGPTTSAAMAVSKGWGDLIIPTLLVGTLGYVIGNYFALIVGIITH